MNVYQATFNAMSDEELKEAIREFRAFDEEKISPTGALLRVIKTLVQTGEAEDTAIGVSRYGLHERAARKRAGV
jgi:hypothetical protein